MDAATRTRKDIENIERQIAHLESGPGADLKTKQQLYELHRQIESLRMQFDLSSAWQKTELARHPQRPYFLDYVERLFPGGARCTGTGVLLTIRRCSAEWPASMAR